MKRSLRKLGAIIATGMSLSAAACHEGAGAPVEHLASVELLVTFPDSKTAGPVFKSLEQASALLVSIEDASGAAVHALERIELHDFGDAHLSHPLSLPPGSYALTELLVVDAGGDVLYATPVEGSALAHLVEDPLAISFDVARDAVTTIRPEVLSTEMRAPEEFGYASFGPIVVEAIDFLVAAFVYDPATRALVLTTASIEVTNESGASLYAGGLDARTNQIAVPEGHAAYSVTISKPGHVPYSRTFTGPELTAAFDEPIAVVLQPAELPPDADVVLLLHMDQGAPFIDDSAYAHAITAEGSIAAQPGQGRFGAGAYFDGNSSTLRVNPQGSELIFTGNEPFTIETWFNGTGAIVSVDDFGFILGVRSGELRVWLIDLLPWIEAGTPAGAVSPGWHHVALSYDGQVYRVFLDGTETLSVAGTMTRSNSNHLRIGGYAFGAQPFFQGHMDELRLVRGAALYTSDFEVPAGPFAP